MLGQVIRSRIDCAGDGHKGKHCSDTFKANAEKIRGKKNGGSMGVRNTRRQKFQSGLTVLSGFYII